MDTGKKVLARTNLANTFEEVNSNYIEAKTLEDNMESCELDDQPITKLNLNKSNFEETSERDSFLNKLRSSAITNRRYNLRPKKKICYVQNTNYDEFLVTTSKQRTNGLLETIFENQISVNGSLMFSGESKLKRSINFNDLVSKTKIRQRKEKIKRLRKVKVKRKKITIEDIKLKLQCLDENFD